MKFHKLITLVVGISILVATLLLMDVRPTQATGECVERVVEKDKELVLKESDVLAIVENAQIWELQSSEPIDEQHMRLTGCSLSEEELRTYFRIHSEPYVLFEILASDAPSGINDVDVLIIGDLNAFWDTRT